MVLWVTSPTASLRREASAFSPFRLCCAACQGQVGKGEGEGEASVTVLTVQQRKKMTGGIAWTPTGAQIEPNSVGSHERNRAEAWTLFVLVGGERHKKGLF